MLDVYIQLNLRLGECFDSGAEKRGTKKMCSGEQTIISISSSFSFPSFPLPSGYARKEPNPIRQISTWSPRSTSHSEAAELHLGADKGSARCWEAEKVVGDDAFSRAFPAGKGFVPSYSCTCFKCCMKIPSSGQCKEKLLELVCGWGHLRNVKCKAQRDSLLCAKWGISSYLRCCTLALVSWEGEVVTGAVGSQFKLEWTSACSHWHQGAGVHRE